MMEVGPDRVPGPTQRHQLGGLSGLLPPRHAKPGVPGAPWFAGVCVLLVIGPPRKSFRPEKAQIELACAGAAVSLPTEGVPPVEGPCTSPASAALAPTPITAAAQVATANSRVLPTIYLPLVVDISRWREQLRLLRSRHEVNAPHSLLPRPRTPAASTLGRTYEARPGRLARRASRTPALHLVDLRRLNGIGDRGREGAGEFRGVLGLRAMVRVPLRRAGVGVARALVCGMSVACPKAISAGNGLKPKRAKGLEPSTYGLGSRRSTN